MTFSALPAWPKTAEAGGDTGKGGWAGAPGKVTAKPMALLGAVPKSTREPSPKVRTHFQEGKACRTRTSRDLQPLTPRGFPERQLVLSPGDATGKEWQGQVAAGLGAKREGLDSSLLK